jgi:uracil-DNA glycosylase family 4
LKLKDAYILSAARCAPPGNKPLPSEIRECRFHLDREIDALPRVNVMVALGKLAWDAALGQLARRGDALEPRPVFGHGAVYHSPSGITLIGSYHPSRQNTHTGRLTPAMLGHVFLTARDLVR